MYAFSNMPSAAKLRAFRRLVRQLEPEVVHSYTFFTNFAAYWGVWGTPSMAFGSIRCDFTFEMQSSGPWLGRLSARWPRDQICNSALAAATVRRWQSPFFPRRLFVVRNGLDLEQFRSAPPMAGGKIRIVGVGTLEPRKRWDRLLIAARELQRRGCDFLVQIVGDGPLHGSLQQQAQDLGIANRVEFMGYSENIPGVLANATFLVHTSDSEGYPNVVMEAMACGRAVVATDAGDIPSLVEDGKTGFVVPRGDEAPLLARMVTLMTDHDLCRRMGEAGRAKAEQQFGLDRLVAETLAAYRAMGWKDA
jgi:glycosyltransferase involved in cell wall biosynthesis